MGFIENFKKLGYRFRAVNDKPKMTKREALREIHAMMCSVDTGEPVAVMQKFAKINVSQYTDAQVKEIFNSIVLLSKQLK